MSITVLCHGVAVDRQRLFPVVLKNGTVENALDLVHKLNNVFGYTIMVPVYICPSVIHVEKMTETGLLSPVFYESLERYVIDSFWYNSYELATAVASAEHRLGQVRAGEKLRVRTCSNGAWSSISITEDMQSEALTKANAAWNKHLDIIREQTNMMREYCELDADAVFSEFASGLNKARVRNSEEVARNAQNTSRSGISRRNVKLK